MTGRLLRWGSEAWAGNPFYLMNHDFEQQVSLGGGTMRPTGISWQLFLHTALKAQGLQRPR